MLQCEDQKLTEEDERIKLVTCEADIAGSYAQCHNVVQLHEMKHREIYYPRKFSIILFSEMYKVLYTRYFLRLQYGSTNMCCGKTFYPILTILDRKQYIMFYHSTTVLTVYCMTKNL